MGDMLTLIEKAEKMFDMEQAKQLEKKLRASQFGLEELLGQLRQVKKMGNLAQLVEMLPGFSKLAPNVADGGEDRMKKIEAIILSMTPEERSNPGVINGSRRPRIAQGSGTTTMDVNQLLNQFHQVQKLTKMAAKSSLPENMVGMFRRK
jgi:signal recognition particle subunit SRP54